MTVSSQNRRVMVVLSAADRDWVDSMAKRFGMSRSGVIGKCVTDTRETLENLDAFGREPDGVKIVVEFVLSRWNASAPKIESQFGELRLV